MNGIWKENLGGYNNKGSKRKTQRRSNTLRDKYKAIEKAFWREERNIDSEIVSIYGKPIPYMFSEKSRYDIPSELRQEGQWITTRKDRMRAKEYIFRSNWEKDVETHKFSKDFCSFYWMMY